MQRKMYKRKIQWRLFTWDITDIKTENKYRKKEWRGIVVLFKNRRRPSVAGIMIDGKFEWDSRLIHELTVFFPTRSGNAINVISKENTDIQRPAFRNNKTRKTINCNGSWIFFLLYFDLSWRTHYRLLTYFLRTPVSLADCHTQPSETYSRGYGIGNSDHVQLLNIFTSMAQAASYRARQWFQTWNFEF